MGTGTSVNQVFKYVHKATCKNAMYVTFSSVIANVFMWTVKGQGVTGVFWEVEQLEISTKVISTIKTREIPGA